MVVASDLNVIDLSDFATRKAEVARQLMQAGTEVGFFYVCASENNSCCEWGRYAVTDLRGIANRSVTTESPKRTSMQLLS